MVEDRGGDGDDLELLPAIVLPDPPCHLATAHPRHAHVQQHDVGPTLGDGREAGAAAVRCTHRHTDALQQPRKNLAIFGHVIDDECIDGVARGQAPDPLPACFVARFVWDTPWG